MLLDEALLMEATLVEDIVEKGDLADISSFDQQWWTVLVSLFRVGRCHIEGETDHRWVISVSIPSVGQQQLTRIAVDQGHHPHPRKQRKSRVAIMAKG
jgi:hypothetical protein